MPQCRRHDLVHDPRVNLSCATTSYESGMPSRASNAAASGCDHRSARATPPRSAPDPTLASRQHIPRRVHFRGAQPHHRLARHQGRPRTCASTISARLQLLRLSRRGRFCPTRPRIQSPASRPRRSSAPAPETGITLALVCQFLHIPVSPPRTPAARSRRIASRRAYRHARWMFGRHVRSPAPSVTI
jgi:hypothetical protein